MAGAAGLVELLAEPPPPPVVLPPAAGASDDAAGPRLEASVPPPQATVVRTVTSARPVASCRRQGVDTCTSYLRSYQRSAFDPSNLARGYACPSIPGEDCKLTPSTPVSV